MRRSSRCRLSSVVSFLEAAAAGSGSGARGVPSRSFTDFFLFSPSARTGRITLLVVSWVSRSASLRSSSSFLASRFSSFFRLSAPPPPLRRSFFRLVRFFLALLLQPPPPSPSDSERLGVPAAATLPPEEEGAVSGAARPPPELIVTRKFSKSLRRSPRVP